MKKNIRFLLYSKLLKLHKWSINGLEERSFIRISVLLTRKRYIIETDDTIEEISITGTSYQVSAEIVAATLKMDELAKILRKQRMADGTITFDKVEVKFNLDEAGEPQGVYFKVSKMPTI
jgi:exoribonuclease R